MRMRCPLCQADSVEKLYDMGGFTLMQCVDCRLVFQDGVDTTVNEEMIGQIYDEGWVKRKTAAAVRDMYNHFPIYFHVVSSHCPPEGSLLEVGCGTGEFLYLMLQTGRKASGMEPSAASCSYAREKFGLSVVNSVWDIALLGPEEKYDAVVLWHVLEHVPNPVVFLSQVKMALRESGCVIFCVPNNNSFTNLILQRKSPVYTEQDHLFHYSAGNLPTLLERSGLRLLDMFTWEPPLRLENEWSIYRSAVPEGDECDIRLQLSFFAWLQAESRGYELFCVAEK